MKWHPKSVVALILGVTVLAFVLLQGAFELVYGPTADVHTKDVVVEFWKEILLAMIGGLLVWVGGKEDGE